MKQEIIVLDSGHGGSDSGAYSNGFPEKLFNWWVANGVKKALNPYDATVYIIQPSIWIPSNTRDELVIPTVFAKTIGATYYLSIHGNSGGGKGFESYVRASEVATYSDWKRNVIHNSVMAYLKKHDIIDRGKKYKDYYVLAETDDLVCDSSLLEILFIDNSRERGLMQDIDFAYEVGNEIAFGLVMALNIERKVK